MLATALALPCTLGLIVLAAWNGYLASKNRTTIECVWADGAEHGDKTGASCVHHHAAVIPPMMVP